MVFFLHIIPTSFNILCVHICSGKDVDIDDDDDDDGKTIKYTKKIWFKKNILNGMKNRKRKIFIQCND